MRIQEEYFDSLFEQNEARSKEDLTQGKCHTFLLGICLAYRLTITKLSGVFGTAYNFCFFSTLLCINLKSKFYRNLVFLLFFALIYLKKYSFHES